MPEQPFAGFSKGMASPFTRALTVAPNDSIDLAIETRALHVGTGGDVSVVTAEGDTVLLKNLVSGAMYPIAIHRVRATGTTAADLVALA